MRPVEFDGTFTINSAMFEHSVHVRRSVPDSRMLSHLEVYYKLERVDPLSQLYFNGAYCDYFFYGLTVDIIRVKSTNFRTILKLNF